MSPNYQAILATICDKMQPLPPRGMSGRVPMGIVTSASHAHFHATHEKLHFLPHFRFVLTDDCYKESKPSPEPYLLAACRT